MRVIAGEKRGKKLTAIASEHIRPTSDKIKGAIFSSLQSDLQTAIVFVDLFAGSGAMGIEALSRGVQSVYFFDVSKQSIAIIKKNLQLTGFEARAKVFKSSAIDALEQLQKEKVKCDLIFMDPPYEMTEKYLILLDSIAKKEILSEHGKLVLESKKSVIIPIEKNNLRCYKSKKYGNSMIRYYDREKNNFENSSLSREF